MPRHLQPPLEAMSHHDNTQDRSSGPILLAVAAPIELEAIASGFGVEAGPDVSKWTVLSLAIGFEAVLTGVGKANAAGGVARVLDPARHSGVISLGIGGALPGGPPLGSLVLGERSDFADEGVESPDGFQDCRAMGFPLMAGDRDSIEPDQGWVAAWRERADLIAPIATVSTCSGTDELARRVRDRTGALVEAMEGAGVGLAARAIDPGMPFAELRVISNTTGDRAGQRWDLAGALEALTGVLGRLGIAPGPDRP